MTVVTTVEFRQNNYVQIHLVYLLNQSEFPYFCSTLVKLVELGKIYNGSVETLKG